jgi:tRNA (guanine37-N1)-methyltransferase
MRFNILTLFPAIFDGYLSQSLLKKAIDAGLVSVELHDFRKWTKDKHQHVDDRPFGGGPGMVIKVEPVVECVEWVQAQSDKPGKVILLTPQGRRLDQQVVEELSKEQRLILLCGRYEGFDHRIIELLRPDEISVGDYVLNGGEVAAMCVVDAVIRLVPGVLGDEESSLTDSFSQGNRLLEHAQYTRPREYRGLSVPDVLLSGDHEEIARWRAEQGFLKTRERRGDLIDGQ